jgi:hypothetical protein
LGPVAVITIVEAFLPARSSSDVSHLGYCARGSSVLKVVRCLLMLARAEEVGIPWTRSGAEGESRWTVVMAGVRWRDCEIVLLSEVAFTASMVFFFLICFIHTALTAKYITAPRALVNPGEVRVLWHILSDTRKSSYPSHQTTLYSPPFHICPPSFWVEPLSLFIIETGSSVPAIPSLQTKYLTKEIKQKSP